MTKPKASQPVNSNMPYVIAVIILATVGMIVAAVILVMRPDSDPLVVSGIVAGLIMPTTLSLLSFMKAQETHLSVNSRLEQFIENAEKAAHAEGELAGRTAANESNDELEARRIK